MRDEVLSKTLNSLKQIESGEIITIHELVTKLGADYKCFAESHADMLWLYKELLLSAKKQNIYLSSAYEWETGLPYIIGLEVKRKYVTTNFIPENCIGVKYVSGGFMCASPEIDVDFNIENLNDRAWSTLMATIFDKCHVPSWYDTYCNHEILDGAYWRLELKCYGEKIYNYYGSNKYPKGLGTLERTFKSIQQVVNSKDTEYGGH